MCADSAKGETLQVLITRVSKTFVGESTIVPAESFYVMTMTFHVSFVCLFGYQGLLDREISHEMDVRVIGKMIDMYLCSPNSHLGQVSA